MSQSQTVTSRYQLISPLGRGGFSEVWRATDLETGELVALKLARAGSVAGAKAKLREEAAILRALNHPNIVRILDSGVDKARDFLVMELIEGPTLRDVLRDSGAMSDEDVAAMGAALADALAAAHGLGLVHGDVKPENIIINSGAPYLIDFGTARNLADTLGPEELRELAGTLAYLAPELLTGEPLSTQSDVYALGVTLYEARSGSLPFAGGGGTLAGSEGRRASPLRYANPSVDSDLESIIMQSLAIDPAWRPGTAGEVRERLVSGRHDTVVLRPSRGDPSTLSEALGAEPVAAAGLPAASIRTPGPGTRFKQPYRAPLPEFGEWADSQHGRRAGPRRLLAVVALASLLLFGAFAATTLLRRDSDESNQSASRDESPVAAAVPTSDGATAPANTAPVTKPTVTQPPTNTPARATPTLEPPAATPAPATPGNVPRIGTQLDAQSGADRVTQWYELVAAGRFDDAYTLWSDRMKANFPRLANLDGRWANTVGVSVNDVRVVSQSGDRMTVAIDFVETLANGASQRYVGRWQLVASNNGWLLDSPSF